MEKYDNKPEKTLLQIVGSSFVIITGLFVMISIANTITGNVIGGSGRINFLDIAIVFWGLLVIAAGIWIIRVKDFTKSIFDSK